MIQHNILSNKKEIKLNKFSEKVWDLLIKAFHIPDKFNYSVFKVTQEYIARPDLLSLTVYGVSDYADLLCKLNNISNPFELNKDMYIIIPDLGYVTEFYKVPTDINDGKLVTSDDSDSLSSTDIINLQKQKNETRKANEQVIGDRNFRIDSNNRIVIY